MSSFDDDLIPHSKMEHIFGDTFIPKYWIRDMKENAKDYGITQQIAIESLEKAVFKWSEETKEYLINHENFPLPGDWFTYTDLFACGCDMTGSPGHDEMVILNLLSIAYPVVPLNIIRQVTHQPLRSPTRSRETGILLSGGDVYLYNNED